MTSLVFQHPGLFLQTWRSADSLSSKVFQGSFLLCCLFLISSLLFVFHLFNLLIKGCHTKTSSSFSISICWSLTTIRLSCSLIPLDVFKAFRIWSLLSSSQPLLMSALESIVWKLEMKFFLAVWGTSFAFWAGAPTFSQFTLELIFTVFWGILIAC